MRVGRFHEYEKLKYQKKKAEYRSQCMCLRSCTYENTLHLSVKVVSTKVLIAKEALNKTYFSHFP